MRSKLTAEDQDWLEQRLNRAFAPVTPRAAFVHDAKQAILHASPGEMDDARRSLAPAAALMLLSAALIVLVTYIAQRRGWLS